MIKIRKVSLNDLEEIYNLNVNLAKYELRFDPVRKKSQRKKRYRHSYDELREKLKKRDCQFFIAEDKGRVVGFIEGCIKKTSPLYKYAKRGEIGPIFLKKEYRERGIGKELAKEMLNWFKSKNIEWIQLTTHAKNTSSIKFWKKMGFKEYSIRLNLLLK